MTKRMNRPRASNTDQDRTGRTLTADDVAASVSAPFTVHDATGALVASGEGGRAEAEAAIAAHDPAYIPIFHNTLEVERKRRQKNNEEILKKYKINC